MSIESLRQHEAVDVVKMVRSKNETDKGNGQPADIVCSLALVLKAEGTEGLGNRRWKKERGIQIDTQLNHAAIVFGVAMKSIDTILRNRVFDSYEFSSYYNEALVGVPGFPKLDDTQTEPEPVSEEKLKKIERYAKADRTRAVFFTTALGYDALPEALRDIIEQTSASYNGNYISTSEIIRERFIPIYKEFARLFVTQSQLAIPEFAGGATETKSTLKPEEISAFNHFAKLYQALPDTKS